MGEVRCRLLERKENRLVRNAYIRSLEIIGEAVAALSNGLSGLFLKFTSVLFQSALNLFIIVNALSFVFIILYPIRYIVNKSNF